MAYAIEAFGRVKKQTQYHCAISFSQVAPGFKTFIV